METNQDPRQANRPEELAKIREFDRAMRGLIHVPKRERPPPAKPQKKDTKKRP